ncbi:hypothetical protein AK830_g5560 [Neonectria ditissima]|uniref:Uncharacterized protein n=1 Tax=Neonectria ditissima TaxID=78410 RepID=A0A0N8H780_9HYPO|nr:hypothetical protein AK830_g5560 [Neonectria ditissima]
MSRASTPTTPIQLLDWKQLPARPDFTSTSTIPPLTLLPDFSAAFKMQDPVPSPPSEEEQLQYYYGLPSLPKLVARSNADYPWVGQIGPWPKVKILSPTRNHIILDLWDDYDGPLRREILQALKPVNWTAIDILCISVNPSCFDKTDEEMTKHPIILLISVEPGSTSFHQGYPVVMQCRQILQRHGVNDIHCEMKESTVFSLGTAPPDAPKLLMEQSHPSCNENHQAMASVYLGSSIGPSDQPERQGTKGLYLRQKDTGAILALTCRHVIFSDAFPNQDYRYRQNDAAPRRTVVQPADGTLKLMMKHVFADIQIEEKAIRDIRASYKPEEWKEQQIRQHEVSLKLCRQWHQSLLGLDDAAMRIIGHVVFSPAFGLGKSNSGQLRLRDWALIEVHPGKHAMDLDLLHNEVMVDSWSANKLQRIQMNEAPSITASVASELVIDRKVRLHGTISEPEMKRPSTCDHADNPTIMVAKFGAKTHFTVGFTNAIKSVTRRPRENLELISEELCILGCKRSSENGRECFSARGDSGACVWDVQGRIGGIVTGGGGNEHAGSHDVTYATPIEWLLEDVKSFGFDVALL